MRLMKKLHKYKDLKIATIGMTFANSIYLAGCYNKSAPIKKNYSASRTVIRDIDLSEDNNNNIDNIIRGFDEVYAVNTVTHPQYMGEMHAGFAYLVVTDNAMAREATRCALAYQRPIFNFKHSCHNTLRHRRTK